MATLLECKCPCGHKLKALALGRDDGKTIEIVDINPKKCLHAFLELGKAFRKNKHVLKEVKI